MVYTRGGQTCSMEESFAENQKYQRAAKPFCSFNTSFTLNQWFYPTGVIRDSLGGNAEPKPQCYSVL